MVPLPPFKVIPHDAEIVGGDVCEMGAAGTLAHRPNPWCGSLETLIHADISMPMDLHSGLFQPDALRIWNPSNGDKKIRTFESALALGSVQTNGDALTR